MSLPTCQVTATIRDQNGAVATDATVIATLNQADRYQGLVVPRRVTAKTDANGQVTLPLFPNTLGSSGSQYSVTIKVGSRRVIDTTATVPNTPDADLYTLLNLEPPDSQTTAQIALAGAQQASANATSSASAAAISESNAATSESNAATSESNAAGSASTASTAASAAQTAQGLAETARTQAQAARDTATAQATTATAQASNAATSATAADNARIAAETAETNAAGSASTASSQATAASQSASAAATSESNAATSETNAATSASNAATSASNAATSATSASQSAQAASNAKTAAETAKADAEDAESTAIEKAAEAATSASAAATSETNAATSASTAQASATQAANSAAASATSAANASASETAAAASESNAAASEGNAATSATQAAGSATAAATSETNASTSASNAATSASAASTAQTAAESARDAAQTALDSFDDRYLGAKASAPTVDNDGDPLVAGALYFDTTADELRAYNGTEWLVAYVPSDTYYDVNNNLSEITDPVAAQGYLELAPLVLPRARLTADRAIPAGNLVITPPPASIPSGTTISVGQDAQWLLTGTGKSLLQYDAASDGWTAPPGTNTPVAGVGDTQTLTNKTLDEPVINNPTITGGSIFNSQIVLQAALWHTHTVSGVAVIPAGCNARSIPPIHIPSGARVEVGADTTWSFFAQ